MSSVLDLLHTLRPLTSSERGCTRIAYSPLEDQAHDLVWERLRSIRGLGRVQDAAGNTFIVPERSIGDPGRRVVLVGSHLDTVIEGGWLDGALGVAVGAAVIERHATDGEADPRVGLVIFRDEEGVRFDTGLFGSSVFAGRCSPENLEVTDREGVRLGDLVPDPAGCVDYTPPVHSAAFLECHIEQGMRLADNGNRIGVVTGMVGIRRFDLRGIGQANHAGTTSMRRRIDALTPVAGIVHRLPSLVADHVDAVITCGRLRVEPGAANIVPGAVTAIVEIRAPEAAALDAIEARLRDLASDVAPAVDGGQVAEVRVDPVVAVPPVPTDQALVARLVETLDHAGISYERLPSMAGHDTQHAALRCPAAMFFIPSIGGISHSPLENSSDEDIELAADVMMSWVKACVRDLA